MSGSDRYSATSGQVGVSLMAAFTVLSWAAIFPLTRWCLQWFTPLELVTLRTLTAAGVLAGGLLFVRPPLPRPRAVVALAICAFFGVALYNLLLSWGLVTLSAGAASFLTNTIPIFTALLSCLFNGERLTRNAVAGMLIAFTGIAIITSSQPGGLSFQSGAILVLGATLCSALYIVLQRRLVSASSPLQTASWLMIFGAVFLVPFSPGAMEAAMAAPPVTLLLLAVLAIVPGALGQIAWLHVLKGIPAGRAATLLYLIPPLATAIGVIWLGETLSLALVIGGAIAISGVSIVHATQTTHQGTTA